MTMLSWIMWFLVMPEAEIKGFRMFDVQPDDFLNELKAQSALYYKSEQHTLLKSLNCRVRKKGVRVYDINSKHGKYEIGKSRLEAWGDVDVQTQSGFTIKMPWMEWMIQRRIMSTPKPLTVTHTDLLIKSVGGRFDMSKEEMSMKRDVDLEYGDLKILSETGFFSFTRGVGDFDGNVKGKGDFGSWTSESAQLKLKSAKASKGGKLQEMDLKGKVHYIASGTDENALEIHSQELKINQNARMGRDPRLHAKKKVHALKKDGSLDMRSESFEVIQISSKAEEIRMDGDVIIRTETQVGRSRSARIRLDTKQITLMSRATMESKGDTIRGEKIIFNMNSDRVEVLDAKGVVK